MMWNCRWLLVCLVIIGLASRVFSMNDETSNKNDTPKTMNSDEKLKSQNELTVKDENQVFPPDPKANANSSVGESSNFTVPLVSDMNVASTSVNVPKLGSHDQSHTKRHFHRSKLYRKETRAKPHASSTKNNDTNGNSTPFSSDHFVHPAQDLFHNSDIKSNFIKLPIRLNSKTSGSGSSKISHAATTSQDYSIPTASSTLFFTNESIKNESNSNFNTLSSRISIGSENSNSSSLSSGSSKSNIDEKSFSVELMSFTFDSVDTLDQSTSKNEAMKREKNLTTSGSIAMDHFSLTPIATIETSDRSIDKSKATSSDLIYAGINLGKSIPSFGNVVDDNDVIIYGIHTETSVSDEFFTALGRDNNVTMNESVNLVPVASESPVVKNSRNTSSKGVEETDDASISTLLNKSNPNSSDVDGYSWISIDDSSNRISLAAVVDTLNNISLQETSGSDSHSNSILSQETSDSSDSKSNLIKTDPVLSEELVALNSVGISKTRTENNIIIQDVKDTGQSTSAELSTVKTDPVERVADEKDEPLRFALDLDPSSSQCSSVSSTERLENMQRNDTENRLSASGNSISELEPTKSSQSRIYENQSPQSSISSEFISTAGHFFAPFTNPDEHCNTSSSSLNIFIPFINSRESIATVKSGEESHNITETEDSIYIIEGFGFLKNNVDEVPEFEEEFDKKKDIAFDNYGEIVTYPVYPHLDGHPGPIKLIDQIEFQAELPLQQEPLVAAGFEWKGNIGDRDDDLWWFNEKPINKLRIEKVNNNIDKRTVLIPSGFEISNKVSVIPSVTDAILPDINESDISSYRIFLLPTIYVLIGICAVLVGCSIWYSKVPFKKESSLPKLTYFIQEKREVSEAVV